ncbi:MAG: DUF3035 domain-containing protein [Rhodospirillales bacterium]|nr:DUF3035 domain-containing protein [Rhodospirillales bacterium]MCB9964804.1 DUF3035 domain-containing protein [Rhodospirillales bacterium]MCB9980490.1 DUF3035 domain-containing protein [Rhodospirillales bacterium]
MRFLPLYLMMLSLPLLAACANPRASLGLTRTAPDEFKVVKNAPLEMPSSLELPVPQPGAPRPQEQAVDQQIRQALIGPEPAARRPDAAEALLLQQAGITPQNEDIRAVIDREYSEQKDGTQSVAQKLLGIGGKNTVDSVLDPAEEARRLQQKQDQQK